MPRPASTRILRVCYPEVSSPRHQLRTVLLGAAKGRSWVRSAICIRSLRRPAGERSADGITKSVREVFRRTKEGPSASIWFSRLSGSWFRFVLCRLRAWLGGLLVAVRRRLSSCRPWATLRRVVGLVYPVRRCLDAGRPALEFANSYASRE